jgi:hypothetical protein
VKDPISLDQAEVMLRNAAADGEFAAAQIAARNYRYAVENAAAGLPRKEAAAQIRHAMTVMESARCRLCVARTRVAIKLQAIERRMRFQQTCALTHTWRIEG